jgi:iron complex outermembrane receptor protein
VKYALLRGVCAASLILVGGFSATQVLAQTAAPPPAPPPATPTAANPADTGQVVVTAERRTQAIEHVPVAVSAFTSKQRDLLGIQTTQQLSDFTPGLSYFASNDRAYIRGIGRNTVSLATESGVATYYNGVYYGANATIAEQHDSLFIGQIEVDRGPQNTLHGSNADGGTLNYISQRPTHDYYAEGRVGVQSYGEYYGEGVVSGPITDWLRFRVGGNYTSESGGYFTNLADNSKVGGNLAQGNNGNQEYFEAQLDANLGPNLDAWAMFSAGDYRTSFHTASTVGTINDYEVPNGSLSPSGFYGLCALGQASNVGCAGGQSIVPGSVVTGLVNAGQFPGNNPSNSNLRNFIQNFTDVNRQDRDIALSTNVTYHFPAADLKYTGGYQSFYYDLDEGSGADSGVLSYQLQGLPAGVASGACPGFAAACEAPLTINPSGQHLTFVEQEQYFSNELSLASTTPGPVQWIGGLYWYHEHYNQPVNALCYPNQPQAFAPSVTLGPTGAPSVGPTAANRSGCLFQEDAVTTYDSVAGYGQVTWQIDPEWKLEVAARYTDDHKTGFEQHRVIGFDDTGLGLPFLGAATPAIDITQLAVFPINPATGRPYQGTSAGFYNAATGQEVRDFDASWGAWTGEATLNWQPDASTLAYLKYSRGYKTGGFNVGTIAAFPETQPEYVDSVEGGFKKTLGRTFQLNAAAFFYNYQNDQQPLEVQNSATGTLVSDIFNIPSVHTYGVELEGIWRPIENLTITGQYSYLNAQVASMNGQCVENTLDPLGILPGSTHGGCPVSGGVQLVNLVGSNLPETPHNKVSLNGLYTWIFDPGKLTLSASYIWKDKTYGSIFNNPQSLAPAYSTVNLKLEWDDNQNRYTISGFVDNLFNTVGYDIVTGTQLAPAGQAYDIVSVKSLTFPLTFGAEFQYRFH